MILKTHPDSAVCVMESLSVSLENFRNHTYRPGQVECRVGRYFYFSCTCAFKAGLSFFFFSSYFLSGTRLPYSALIMTVSKATLPESEVKSWDLQKCGQD